VRWIPLQDVGKGVCCLRELGPNRTTPRDFIPIKISPLNRTRGGGSLARDWSSGTPRSLRKERRRRVCIRPGSAFSILQQLKPPAGLHCDVSITSGITLIDVSEKKPATSSSSSCYHVLGGRSYLTTPSATGAERETRLEMHKCEKFASPLDWLLSPPWKLR